MLRLECVVHSGVKQHILLLAFDLAFYSAFYSAFGSVSSAYDSIPNWL